jgi:hypothetical protein
MAECKSPLQQNLIALKKATMLFVPKRERKECATIKFIAVSWDCSVVFALQSYNPFIR